MVRKINYLAHTIPYLGAKNHTRPGANFLKLFDVKLLESRSLNQVIVTI